MSTTFSNPELARYSRHIILPEFNIEGQAKLKNARVLVVGAGGLGSPMLLYLAAAGVGTIGIVDFDRVEDHNLQRQVLFGVRDIGQSKAHAAKARILDLNPYIQVVVHEVALRADNALEIIGAYDVVADGTDNFQTRYLVNDACVLLGKVNVYASIFRFDGQVSVFNLLQADGSRGPNYRDLYPTPPPPGMVPSCAEGGVLGVLPGIIGSLQANEVIKVVAGIGEPLSGRLYLFEALTFESRTLKIRKDPANPLNGSHPTMTGLIDYDQFCGIHPAQAAVPQDGETTVTVQQFRAMQQSKQPFQLIDVREAYEFDIANLGGHLIPLGEVLARQDEIRRDV
ncbi:MAG TPA: molybdopterin-synthase adenylyltransferase MoeB, partial [Bacteroidia bacterium]|nr:molybdopterin-synthase adenylyltransferase MoeB [Bacteroidia bacterium]